MTEKRDKDCNLKVTRNGRNECWALCNKYHNSHNCCMSCDESDYCNKVCKFLRDREERK